MRAGLISTSWYQSASPFTILQIFIIFETSESEPLMLTCKSAAVPCCCVGCCRERLKIARIPQAHKLPQASFRSRIPKDVCVYPSLCTLFLTTQHPRSFLCLHRLEHWLSFTPNHISPFWYKKLLKRYFLFVSFILFQINLLINIFFLFRSCFKMCVFSSCLKKTIMRRIDHVAVSCFSNNVRLVNIT